MFVSHDNAQKWYYLNKHNTDEVTIIKIWDNKNVTAKCKPFPTYCDENCTF